MMLYDTPADIVQKALRGLGLAANDVAASAQLSPAEFQRFLDGEFSTASARQISPALGLDPEALAALPDYHPAPDFPPGLIRIPLPFDDEEVNVWLLQIDDCALLIDAGFRGQDLATALDQAGISSAALLLTHSHRDHLGGLASIRQRVTELRAREALPGATLTRPGDQFSIGPFTIQAFDLAGHHPQALGYHISGLDRPLTAVGDAVFAGSMGGCPNPAAFAQARQTITDSILPLVPETVLLTGHGPATTLADERRSNPFLAAW